MDQLTETAQKLNVTAMPTFKILRGANVVSDVIGANPEKLKTAIDAALGVVRNSDGTVKSIKGEEVGPDF